MTFLLLALTALVAGLARGFSGFGAALIFVPLASAILGPKLAAPLLLLTDGIVAAPLIWSNWSKAEKPEVGLMSLGCIMGLPLGTVILTQGDPLVLRWLIVGLAACMLALLLSGWTYHGKPHAAATTTVGALSGLFSGIAQIGGPPVVAYWLGVGKEPAIMRASTILYFAISTLLAGIAYFIGGLLTRDVLMLALMLVPFFGGGLWIGSRIFGLAPAQHFRQVCLGLIALSVVISLPVWT